MQNHELNLDKFNIEQHYRQRLMRDLKNVERYSVKILDGNFIEVKFFYLTVVMYIPHRYPFVGPNNICITESTYLNLDKTYKKKSSVTNSACVGRGKISLMSEWSPELTLESIINEIIDLIKNLEEVVQ